MATASDKFGLYSECCERFLAPSTSPTFSWGERHPTSISWASSCGFQAVLMCRMTYGCRCRCRQADNYELQSCALRPQSGPPPPRKKRLGAMRCSTLPGRRLYERLPERRLKLLATHWPPTPRSRARGLRVKVYPNPIPDKDYMVEERAQRLPQRPVYCSILQYTAVYCSILQYTEIFGFFFLFFSHSRLLGRRWSRR